MIAGAHFLLYSRDPERDRPFFRDVLGFHAVDAGGGWLIFRLSARRAGRPPGQRGTSSSGTRTRTCSAASSI